jgi:hypothetical protein
MSYEGYEQHLCENGHYYTRDADYSYGEPSPCPYCNAKCAWINCVDQTNGPSQGLIDMKNLLVTPEVVETCNLGHKHITKQAIYRIPSKEEKKSLRQHFDED